ncbi:MAG: hypothetical protein UZ22_OP11002000373 [Microgenomates bacterium OLB23]|nr:MAG: hypothetical protein UZ22_OP11002000373 [Microgenomates bacterium OLB23]
MFPTQYAFLPWILYYTFASLSSPSHKTFVMFFLISFLATPQAYAAQLWYAFFGTYVLVLIFHIALHKDKYTQFKRAGILIF